VPHTEASFRKRLEPLPIEERKYLLNHCYAVVEHGDRILETVGACGELELLRAQNENAAL
jgi:hypothetical protein